MIMVTGEDHRDKIPRPKYFPQPGPEKRRINMLIKKVAGDGHNCSTFLPGQVGKFLQRGPPFGSAFTKV
jgi:hypothetical protein